MGRKIKEAVKTHPAPANPQTAAAVAEATGANTSLVAINPVFLRTTPRQRLLKNDKNDLRRDVGIHKHFLLDSQLKKAE